MWVQLPPRALSTIFKVWDRLPCGPLAHATVAVTSISILVTSNISNHTLLYNIELKEMQMYLEKNITLQIAMPMSVLIYSSRLHPDKLRAYSFKPSKPSEF